MRLRCFQTAAPAPSVRVLPILAMMDELRVGRIHRVSVFPVHIANLSRAAMMQWVNHLPSVPRLRLGVRFRDHWIFCTRDPSNDIFIRMFLNLRYLNTDNEEVDDHATIRRPRPTYRPDYLLEDLAPG